MKKVQPILLVILALTILPILSFSRSSFVVRAAATHLVISQVQIAGATTNDDFIELYNPTSSPINLNGDRLVKRTSTGVTDTSLKSFTTDTFVPAFGYYLWANSGWTPSATPDTSTSGTIAADNGIALRNGPNDTGTIVDSVAWGGATNAFIEGSVYPNNPPAGNSIQRKLDENNGHGTDTDNNSADFEALEVSSPRNSSSVVSSPSPTPTGSVSPTATPTSTATPTPTASPAPTDTPTSTGTPVPTDTPNPSPTATPTATPTEIPTNSPTDTPTVSPTPTPKDHDHDNDHRDNHRFNFHAPKLVCSVKYEKKRFGRFIVFIPHVSCRFE